MIYTIENDHFKVGVNECGAELYSIVSKKSDIEYIWQADPQVWAGSAPVLFPVIGGLKDGEYSFEENTYKLPKHGFVRHNTDVQMVNRAESRLLFRLTSNETTRKSYPFEFEFKISFLLRDNRLQVFHEIINKGDGPLFFSLGGHPAFSYPWKEGENKDDYFLEFEREENNTIFDLKEGCLLGREELPGLKNSKKLQLVDGLFDNDALIYTELNSSEVSLKSKTSKRKIKVNFDDFPFLGVWSKPGANFVCIEPWDGLPDFEDSTKELINKPGILKLLPGNIHYASYTIQIFEK